MLCLTVSLHIDLVVASAESFAQLVVLLARLRFYEKLILATYFLTLQAVWSNVLMV